VSTQAVISSNARVVNKRNRQKGTSLKLTRNGNCRDQTELTVVKQFTLNPLPAVLAAPSLEKQPTKVPNLKSLTPFRMNT